MVGAVSVFSALPDRTDCTHVDLSNTGITNLIQNGCACCLTGRPKWKRARVLFLLGLLKMSAVMNVCWSANNFKTSNHLVPEQHIL